MSVVQFKCQMQSKAFVKMVLPLHCNIYWSQTAVHYSTHCTMYVQCTHCTGSLVTTNQLSQQSSRQAPCRAASQFLRFREGEVLKKHKEGGTQRTTKHHGGPQHRHRHRHRGGCRGLSYGYWSQVIWWILYSMLKVSSSVYKYAFLVKIE